MLFGEALSKAMRHLNFASSKAIDYADQFAVATRPHWDTLTRAYDDNIRPQVDTHLIPLYEQKLFPLYNKKIVQVYEKQILPLYREKVDPIVKDLNSKVLNYRDRGMEAVVVFHEHSIVPTVSLIFVFGLALHIISSALFWFVLWFTFLPFRFFWYFFTLKWLSLRKRYGGFEKAVKPKGKGKMKRNNLK